MKINKYIIYICRQTGKRKNRRERRRTQREDKEKTERGDKDGLKDRHKVEATVRGRQSKPKKTLHENRHACQTDTTKKQQTMIISLSSHVPFCNVM